MSLNIQSARFTYDALILMIDGRPAWVDTKKSLLDAGIAILGDDGSDDSYWQEHLMEVLPANPEGGLNQPLRVSGGTRDPRVVALARQYWHASNSNDFQEHDVPVPPHE